MLYFNHCISDISTGNNWTISACDGSLDNVYSTSCRNPAVILYGVHIVNETNRETSLHHEIIATSSSSTLTTLLHVSSLSTEGKWIKTLTLFKTDDILILFL